MSQQDLAKVVPNTVDPKLWPNPRNISLGQLQKYVSLDQTKMGHSFKNYKRSLPYLAGVLVGCFFMKTAIDSHVKNFIFGENGNGGEILRMKTYNSIHDYTYNRQFQRMRYLTEQPSGDDPNVKTRDELLVDLGVEVKPLGLNKNVVKRVPHDKYLL